MALERFTFQQHEETDAEADARACQYLSAEEQQTLLEGFLRRHGGMHVDDADLDALAVQGQQIIEWALQARLAATTVELALKGLVDLDWSPEGRIIARPSDDGRAALALMG